MSDSRPLRRLQKRALAVLLGAGLALAVGFAVLATWTRPTTPPLTREALALARERWHAASVRDYDLDVEIFGRQPGVVHLEVRDGAPTAMTRDGRTPSQRRTWDAWTVEYQLSTIADELAGANDPARAFGAPADARVVQRAQFDPELGYPIDYQRAVLGTPLDVEWRTVRFIRRDPSPALAEAP